MPMNELTLRLSWLRICNLLISFLDSQYEPLLTLTDEYYPKLVRMFFAKIRIVRMGVELSLECQAKYTKFTPNEFVLDHILALPLVVQPRLSQQEYKNRCPAQFAH